MPRIDVHCAWVVPDLMRTEHIRTLEVGRGNRVAPSPTTLGLFRSMNAYEIAAALVDLEKHPS